MLEIRDLSVYYGGIRALNGISFQVRAGELTTLIGSNGAGKSTTLKTISGLLRAKQGSITYHGEDITRASSERIVAAGISHCPEGRRIFASLSVRENLQLGAAQRKDTDGIAQDMESMLVLFPRLHERIQQVGGTLSGGEQQMLAIARALMSRPKLLMLDEPSLGLAPIMVEKIFEVIRELKTQGKTILLVEQSVHQALEVADQAFVLETGQVSLSGRAADLKHNPQVEQSYLGK
jgi:branched-chain amino acid transport system ATP-binding protein